MSDGKLKSRPPTPSSSGVEDFISGAGTLTQEEAKESAREESREAVSQHETYLWEAPTVRDDVNKLFNLRLPEPYLLKLKYIAEHTPDSMQQFCLAVLLPAIDAKIVDLTGKK